MSKDTDYIGDSISGGRSQEDEINLQETTNYISDLITASKDSDFTNLGKRLNHPNTSKLIGQF